LVISQLLRNYAGHCLELMAALCEFCAAV
jgi:hypothetical protein